MLNENFSVIFKHRAYYTTRFSFYSLFLLKFFFFVLIENVAVLLWLENRDDDESVRVGEVAS